MNCKPGDLAYIVRDDDTPSDIGKVVEILRICPPNEWLYPGAPEWECRSRTPLTGFNARGRVSMDHELDIPDAWLRPIGGVPLNDETPIEINVPEALRLALGIESRWSA